MEHQGLGMAGWKDMDGLCTYASQHSRLLCQLGPRLSVSQTGLFTTCLSPSLLYQYAQQRRDPWKARVVEVDITKMTFNIRSLTVALIADSLFHLHFVLQIVCLQISTGEPFAILEFRFLPSKSPLRPVLTPDMRKESASCFSRQGY